MEPQFKAHDFAGLTSPIAVDAGQASRHHHRFFRTTPSRRDWSNLMPDNENQPTELENLRKELLRFVADETARGALDGSNPELGPKLVEAIAAKVDSQTGASVAKQLEAFRTELRKELREIGLDRTIAGQGESNASHRFRSQTTKHDSAPLNDKEGGGDKEEEQAGGILAGFKRNFLAIAAMILLGSTSVLGFLFYQTDARVAGLQAKVNALCTVKAKVAQQLDRDTPVPATAAATQASGGNAEPPKQSLSEAIYKILEFDRSCPKKGEQGSQ